MGLNKSKQSRSESETIVKEIKHTDKSVTEFVMDLSSKDPVPGGGGASAVTGALGSALGGMVASLTIGKEKYKDVEEDLKVLKSRSYVLQKELLELAQQDAEVFSKLAGVYKMPNSTDEEKENKTRIMEAALKDAADVPLKIMKKTCEAINIMEDFAKKGSKLAVSDAGCGVILCKSALQSAWLNVCINTKSMKDRNYADKINREGQDLLNESMNTADKIYEYVEQQLL